MIRLLRSAFVIARRDFTATVLSKAFLFFLLGPLFPLLLGGVFGGIGARVASQTETPIVAFVGSTSEFDRLQSARKRLAEAIDEEGVVRLVRFAPAADPAAQQAQLLATKNPPVRAVLTGGLAKPHLAGAIAADSSPAHQLNYMFADARTPDRRGAELSVSETRNSSGSLSKDRAITAQIGQMILFFLTILLSGMLLSQLIEEKSNKIIEVIAAAVPIDALFIGKLFAMLAASIVGILVWTSAGAAVIEWVLPGGIGALPPPAIGWPAFLTLTIIYFAMNYLLLGAVFLTIGAQASTVREVQTLSMPVTFAQVVIFGFAATAIGTPDSTEGIAAAAFPLSSPLVMVARAAEQPDLWPHLVAIVWQVLWVVLILKIGARMFRKSVLKSGPSKRRWFRGWRGATLRGADIS
jgi:ABC-2 type transport system permease protein